MTRAGAAKLIGLNDRGHLGVGAAADITIYTDQPDREAMFAKPDYVFKDGELVVYPNNLIVSRPVVVKSDGYGKSLKSPAISQLERWKKRRQKSVPRRQWSFLRSSSLKNFQNLSHTNSPVECNNVLQLQGP